MKRRPVKSLRKGTREEKEKKKKMKDEASSSEAEDNRTSIDSKTNQDIQEVSSSLESQMICIGAHCSIAGNSFLKP